MSKIEIKNIYKIFGNKPQSIMPWLKMVEQKMIF